MSDPSQENPVAPDGDQPPHPIAPGNHARNRPDEPTSARDSPSIPLRIWPVVLLLTAMAVTKYGPRLLDGESMALLVLMVLGPVALGAGILLWWLTLSRATWKERMIGFFGALIAAGATAAAADFTLVGPGMIVMMVPMGTAAFGLAAILAHRAQPFRRTATVLLASTIGFGFTALLRSDGMWGDGSIDWQWRWQPSAEETLLAGRPEQPSFETSGLAAEQADAWIANPEWPGFRGADGQSQLVDIELNGDWVQYPPKELWRIPVGPGWSSFAVAGNLIFTQEQLGEEEAVSCYTADEGKTIWSHKIRSRFFDPLGGPGPRATPTLAESGLFVMGANGQVQRLDPITGEVAWSIDVREIANREPPTWGFSSSPLVVDSLVVVHAGGADDKGILAFRSDNGKLAWSQPSGDHSYSSPQLATLGGKRCVLMLTNAGLDIIDPKLGRTLLSYEWPHDGYRTLQPRVLPDESILLPTQILGTRRIRLNTDTDPWTAEEMWTCDRFKPDFNDFVVFEDHAYGFDGTIFACMNLNSGQRVWKRGRYG
ncbi:MAG: PQQ-binding-like beta-propeller repeat protein, partial [Planctomycetota bacterium]